MLLGLVAAASLWSSSASPAASAPAAAAVDDLALYAHLDLGPLAPNGEVAAVGALAVVGVGCPAPAVVVVDVADRHRPRPVATIALPALPRSLATARLASPTFSGTVAAVAVGGQGCGGEDVTAPAVRLYDLSHPDGPVLLSVFGEGAAAASVSVRRDGRAVAVVASPGAVQSFDITAPADPLAQGEWVVRAAGASPVVCDGLAGAGAVHTFDRGEQALVTVDGGPVWPLDISGPSPVEAEAPLGPARHLTAALVADHTVVLLAAPGCRDLPALVAVELHPGRAPGPVHDLAAAGAAFDVTGPAASAGPSVDVAGAGGWPGRVVASGEMAFAAAGPAGLVVVDLARRPMAVVARFVPPGPVPDATADVGGVTGVAVLADWLVAVGPGGLFVTERPDEGVRGSSWEDTKMALAAFAMAAAIGLMAVPRIFLAKAELGRPATPATAHARPRPGPNRR